MFFAIPHIALHVARTALSSELIRRIRFVARDPGEVHDEGCCLL